MGFPSCCWSFLNFEHQRQPKGAAASVSEGWQRVRLRRLSQTSDEKIEPGRPQGCVVALVSVTTPGKVPAYRFAHAGYGTVPIPFLTNGIFVAITFHRNSTFGIESCRPCRPRRRRLPSRPCALVSSAVGLHHAGPWTMLSVIGVAALPMSTGRRRCRICGRRELLALVRPVMACWSRCRPKE